jgi:hypothetical protein
MLERILQMPIARKLAISILLFGLICHAKDEKSDVEKLVNPIVNWGEKISTPGAKAELRFASEEEKDSKNISSYALIVTGVPYDQSYALFYWPISEQKPALAIPELYIGPDGACINPDDCHPGADSYLKLSFNPAKGEPYRILVVSKDGKYKVATLFVPKPILGDDHGCTVEVIRGTPKFELAIIRGKGFKPKDHIKYTSKSEDEILQGEETADESGKFTFAVAPFVKGKNQGRGDITFAASGCAPKVSYDWGTTH